MADAVQIDCEVLSGAPGWVKCRVGVGPQVVEIGPFSHALTDGLDDLARAALAIATGAGVANFSMDDEPQPRWEWRIQRVQRWPPREELSVAITRIDDLDRPGTAILSAFCEADEFGGAVATAMRRMRERQSAAGLLQNWPHFPERAVAALERALAIEAS